MPNFYFRKEGYVLDYTFTQFQYISALIVVNQTFTKTFQLFKVLRLGLQVAAALLTFEETKKYIYKIKEKKYQEAPKQDH